MNNGVMEWLAQLYNAPSSGSNDPGEKQHAGNLNRLAVRGAITCTVERFSVGIIIQPLLSFLIHPPVLLYVPK